MPIKMYIFAVRQDKNPISLLVCQAINIDTVWRKILMGENFDEWACGKF